MPARRTELDASLSLPPAPCGDALAASADDYRRIGTRRPGAVKIPNSDPVKIDALRQHMTGGGLILALVLVGLLVRVRTPPPAPALSGHCLPDKLARVSH